MQKIFFDYGKHVREKKIFEYINSNLKNANLDELAALLGYTSVYTSTLVKKLTGKNFSLLLIEKRCEFAAKLLSETDMQVRDIITAIGYGNESFFRKSFKAFYGVNPVAYRKASK